MFRVVTSNRPVVGKNMWEMIAQKRFSAIVLEKDPASALGRKWHDKTHFGGEFLHDLQGNYSLSANVEGVYIFLPQQLPHTPSENSE
jgi:hypothetical protein